MRNRMVPNCSIYSCRPNKKTCSIKPKSRLRSPIFESNCLKSGERASQLTLLCLVFDGSILRYAADLVLNSTVLLQIVYLPRNRLQDKWCAVDSIFSNF